MHFPSSIQVALSFLHLTLVLATCNANNCLRALRNPKHSVKASDFCSSYIPPVSTVTNITYSVTTLTLFNEATIPFTTITLDRTTTVVATVTSTHSHTLPSPPPRTTTSSTNGEDLYPRTVLPSFLSACSWEAGKISSACSCLVTPTTTVWETSTSYVVTDGIITLPTETTTESTLVTVFTTTTEQLYEP